VSTQPGDRGLGIPGVPGIDGQTGQCVDHEGGVAAGTAQREVVHYAEAKKIGITGRSTMTKAELIKSLRNR
jgi:hypothetical protein